MFADEAQKLDAAPKAGGEDSVANKVRSPPNLRLNFVKIPDVYISTVCPSPNCSLFTYIAVKPLHARGQIGDLSRGSVSGAEVDTLFRICVLLSGCGLLMWRYRWFNFSDYL